MLDLGPDKLAWGQAGQDSQSCMCVAELQLHAVRQQPPRQSTAAQHTANQHALPESTLFGPHEQHRNAASCFVHEHWLQDRRGDSPTGFEGFTSSADIGVCPLRLELIYKSKTSMAKCSCHGSPPVCVNCNTMARGRLGHISNMISWMPMIAPTVISTTNDYLAPCRPTCCFVRSRTALCLFVGGMPRLCCLDEDPRASRRSCRQATGARVAAAVPPCCVPACSLMKHSWLGEAPIEIQAKRPSLSTDVSSCSLLIHVHAIPAFGACLACIHIHVVHSADTMACGKWS